MLEADLYTPDSQPDNNKPLQSDQTGTQNSHNLSHKIKRAPREEDMMTMLDQSCILSFLSVIGS